MKTIYTPRKNIVTFRSTQYFDIGTSFIHRHDGEALQVGEVVGLQIADVYGKAVITEIGKYPNQYIARRFL